MREFTTGEKSPLRIGPTNSKRKEKTKEKMKSWFGKLAEYTGSLAQWYSAWIYLLNMLGFPVFWHLLDLNDQNDDLQKVARHCIAIRAWAGTVLILAIFSQWFVVEQWPLALASVWWIIIHLIAIASCIFPAGVKQKVASKCEWLPKFSYRNNYFIYIWEKPSSEAKNKDAPVKNYTVKVEES